MDMNSVAEKAKLVAKQMVAERAKVDLFYLCKYVLGYGEIMDPKVHGPLCRNLRVLLFYKEPGKAFTYEFPSDFGVDEKPGIPMEDQLPTEAQKAEFWEWEDQFEPQIDELHSVSDKLQDDLTSLLALMPRGTLKSSIITIGFTIQWLLNYGDDRVLIDSETFTKSKAFLTEIKGHYESDEFFREIFYTIYGIYPDQKKTTVQKGTDTWSTETIVLANRSRKRKEPSVDCAGIDVTKNGMHYDLVIMDDLHSEKNTRNAEQIEQVKEHYRLVYSLLEPGHPAVVVGTRWDYNDLYQMIIDEEQEDFNFITRSAESTDGAIFYPGRLSKKELDKFRRKQGPYIFSCQYMNNPVDNENATFKKSMFNYMTLDQVNKESINWYGLVDPSWKGESSDYAAIVIGGMDSRGEIYCKFIWRDKATYGEIVKKMFEIDKMFAPRQWLLETVATQKSIQYFLAQEQRRQMRPLRVKEVRGVRAQKEERIMGLATYYELGRAHHIKGCPNLDILEGELIRFPKSKYDDVSDCFAGLLEVAQPARGVVLSKEKAESRKEYFRKLNKPRSPMVGY